MTLKPQLMIINSMTYNIKLHLRLMQNKDKYSNLKVIEIQKKINNVKIDIEKLLKDRKILKLNDSFNMQK